MRILLLSISFFILVSCTNNPSNENANNTSIEANDAEMKVDMHNSKTALDWNGRYTGMLPCADCEGIETLIALNEDGTYQMRQVYLGKGAEPIEELGEFIWSEDGGSITLDANGQKFKVGENILIFLDQSGNEITGELADNYRLNKAYADSEIEDITWELTKLGGKEISAEDNTPNAYFILNSAEGRVSGNLGCNNFFGNYELKNGMRISFGQLGVTMKACPDMSTENQLNEIFGTVDNYSVKDGVLSLNKARMAPLAVFKAVKK